MLMIQRNGVVKPEEIADIRQSVGWDRSEETYKKTLSALYAYYTVRLEERLIGYLGVVSDGVADAMLVDIVIHRDYQKQGFGRKLVKRAIRDLRDDGIRGIQLTFPPKLQEFYKKVGFKITYGGLLDFKYMDWNADIDS